MASSAAAAASALLQKASQQYLECRRKVTAKVDEVKAIDAEIEALFAKIVEAEKAGASKKSVGRLEVTIAAVSGKAPVEGATIDVTIDPEYDEEDDAEAVEQQAAPKAEKEVTEEVTKPAEAEAEAAAEETEKQAEEEEAAPAQTEEAVAEEAEEAAEEAAPYNPWNLSPVVDEPAYSDDEAEKDVAKEEPAVNPPVAEEPVVEAAKEEEVAVEAPVAEQPTPAKASTAVAWESVPASFVFERVQSREAFVTVTVAPPAMEANDEDPIKEIQFPVSSLLASNEFDQWYAISEEAEAESADTTITEVTEESEAARAEQPRVQVKATFEPSALEKLNLVYLELSKKKKEAEASLAAVEREAASLRTKYERLTATQRSLTSAGAQGGKGGKSALFNNLNAQAAADKSRYQKLKDSINSVLTPQRQQVLISVAMFVGSVTVFHAYGDNLLA
ncbi:TPA: hypothetical protein N0F65_002640 [Lagenidium giganteum]|uniref:Uncharacterized protein n=1 Tax=Lagenidium giganteum TaxID=4803 RepID=A0AAV2Z5Q9_9STRA|nr:TPA: hypothetical protein N0F65_002640 [Lagenidium giganteum]